jgi:16S rRNA (guanine527-N7)-methyltransferase
VTREEFQRVTDVSRETLARLAVYHDLLSRWQTRINLVGKSTLKEAWRRHFLDCAQLAPLVSPGIRTITDLGSGAGFPGLVLSIMLGIETSLVEADERKCAFLREVARLTDAPVVIRAGRIEAQAPWASDLVVSRALAPISDLLRYAWPFLSLSDSPFRACLLLKGENFESELTPALENWKMRVDSRPSISDPRGRVLVIQDLTPEVNAHGRQHAPRNRGSNQGGGRPGA